MTSIDELMRNIAHADVDPGVFHVSLVASSHTDGFEAIVVFRGSAMAGYHGLTHHAGTAEAALLGVGRLLETAHGRCALCGQHRNTEGDA